MIYPPLCENAQLPGDNVLMNVSNSILRAIYRSFVIHVRYVCSCKNIKQNITIKIVIALS